VLGAAPCADGPRTGDPATSAAPVARRRGSGDLDEVAFAIDERKTLLPVLYRGCDVPFRLRRLQHIDFTDEHDKALTRLLTALASSPADTARTTLSATTRHLGRMATRRVAVGVAAIVVAGALGWALVARREPPVGPAANGPPWMTSEQYQAAFDKQVQEGLYPYKLEGRCANGVEKFQVQWKGFPLGSEGFVSHHGITREFYERKNQEYSAMGASLESLNSFRDCRGDDKYQANWFKRKRPTGVGPAGS
jgi:hypothetical protein